MWVRIKHPWCREEHAFPTALIGRVLNIRESLAKYLMAMRCAERASNPKVRTKTAPRWRIQQSIAEARVRIAGRWNRLCLEIDSAILGECNFYRDAAPWPASGTPRSPRAGC